MLAASKVLFYSQDTGNAVQQVSNELKCLLEALTPCLPRNCMVGPVGVHLGATDSYRGFVFGSLVA